MTRSRANVEGARAPRQGTCTRSCEGSARARVKRHEQATQRVRQRNTDQLQSGVTCDQLGASDILVTPGADIDADGDGVGCES